jgi:hypothetical protein
LTRLAADKERIHRRQEATGPRLGFQLKKKKETNNKAMDSLYNMGPWAVILGFPKGWLAPNLLSGASTVDEIPWVLLLWL